MSFLCLLGRHRVSLASIMPKKGGYVGLCERCDRPLERQPTSNWVASDPLDIPQGRAA